MRQNPKNILFEIKKYLISFNKQKYSPDFNTSYYLCPTSNSIGLYLLKKIANISHDNFFSNLSLIIKDLASILNFINSSVIYKNIRSDYKNIVVTWATKENFKLNGVFKDKYFNIESHKLKKTLWFIIYLGDEIPQKINDDIIILKQNKKSFNLLKFLPFFANNLKFLILNFNYFLSSVSGFNFSSNIVLENIKPFLNSSNVQNLFMPYEGQPFQNRLIQFIKEKKLKIKTIGYIHALPLALPAHYIHKRFSPDEIIVNGKDQYYCFNQILGWKKAKIKILPSFRFTTSNIKAKNLIYLPYLVKKPNLILKSLKNLVRDSHINIKKMRVRNHPLSSRFVINLKLKHKIKDLIKNSPESLTKNKKNSLIFIGSSGAIIEALERGFKVIQIAEEPLIDTYSEKIWPSIKQKKISKNIYTYTLKKKGNLIKFGSKKNNLSFIKSINYIKSYY